MEPTSRNGDENDVRYASPTLRLLCCYREGIVVISATVLLPIIFMMY